MYVFRVIYNLGLQKSIKILREMLKVAKINSLQEKSITTNGNVKSLLKKIHNHNKSYNNADEVAQNCNET